MHVSHLSFHTIPSKTGEVEQELKKLRDLVAGGRRGEAADTPYPFCLFGRA
jgi:hypothetical protein